MIGSRKRPGGRAVRLSFALAGSMIMLAFGPAASLASQAMFTLDEGKPALERLDTGGWSAKISLTNLTDGPVQLKASTLHPAASASCTVQFQTGPTATLQASRDQAVTVTYAQGCKLGESGATLALATVGPSPQSLEVAVDPAGEASPDWDILWAFAIALGASLLLLFGALVTNERMTFGTQLSHLPTTWSFKESWATNVTAGGGILAGIVGSTEVVKAFLGVEADSQIALAIVGAAVAAAFLAFGALLVQTVKDTSSESPTAGGFVLGASCTLAGAFGELVTLYVTGKNLDLGGWQNRLLPIVIVIGIVLLAYAYISVRATLEVGTTSTPPQPLSEETVTAVTLASMCCSRGINTDETFALIEARLTPKLKVTKQARFRLRHPSRGVLGDEPPKRVGAALL